MINFKKMDSIEGIEPYNYMIQLAYENGYYESLIESVKEYIRAERYLDAEVLRAMLGMRSAKEETHGSDKQD